MDNVMVIGPGGREDALVRKLAESEHVGTVYWAMLNGNGGARFTPKCKVVDLKSYDDMADFAEQNGVHLSVVGPEKHLIGGIGDVFSQRGLRLFGPGSYGAMLEGSKKYAKNFMREYGIPTAPFRTFTDPDEAKAYAETSGPVYVKASGPAEGKGAIDGSTPEKARRAIDRIMVDREFGDSGNEVIIEDFLDGEEASCMTFVNSEAGIAVPMEYSQDHKKEGEGETGRNTGGMGAYAPTKLITQELDRKIKHRVVSKILYGLQDSGIPYKGVIYPGLKIKNGNPFVLEINDRLGDPETQVVMKKLMSDLYVAMSDTVDGRVPELKSRDGYAVCVVLVSGGYPGKYEKGKRISGLDVERDNVTVFHAGTVYENGSFYTNGGRVLGVTAVGNTIIEARDRAYEAAESIRFDGKQFRKDIAEREIRRAA